MTQTDVNLGELQKEITNLSGVSENGWVLQWGDAGNPAFEIVCRQANAMQVKNINDRVSAAYEEALARR